MKTKNKFIITILIFTLSSFILLIESKDILANTLTIQPSTNDNYIYQGASNTNYGTSTAILTVGGYDSLFAHSLLNFNFTSLPAGATITGATLNLYYYAYVTNNPVGNTLWAYEINTPGYFWTETGSTWNKYDGTNAWLTAGGDYTTTNGASLTVPGSYGWMSWNVLALAQHFQSTHGNFAQFLILDADTTSGTYYQTTWYSNNYVDNTTLRPKLIITYTLPDPCTVISNNTNWNINNTCSKLNEEIDLSYGNITLQDRGSLNLTNVNITFCGLYIQPGKPTIRNALKISPGSKVNFFRKCYGPT